MNTLITTTSIASDATVRSEGRFVRAGLVAGATAAVANVAVVASARAFDVSMQVKGETIPLLAFPQMTLIASVIAVGLATVLRRRSGHPRTTFVRTTVLLTALFTLPPILVDASWSTKLVLELTHLVVAVLVIPAVSARLPDARHQAAASAV